VVVTVNANVSGTITNTATVNTPNDPNPGNNTDNEPTTVNSPPDLRLTKTDGGITTTPGGIITYTLNYTNVGGTNATGIIITETVPANTTFTGAGWICVPNNNAGSVCTFNVGSLAAGASGSATFIVTVVNPLPAGVTQIANSATIGDDGSNGPDPNPGDNTGGDNTPVNAAPDMAVTKGDGGVAAITPGQVVTYTLVYTNVGKHHVLWSQSTVELRHRLTRRHHLYPHCRRGGGGRGRHLHLCRAVGQSPAALHHFHHQHRRHRR
jgi:uncharacterized repeat protein (TIGR01451 family)